jgi:uncharacterized protein involved in response to NO
VKRQWIVSAPRGAGTPATPVAGVPERGFALFALGFRPFYLGASVFAALSVLLWVGGYAGAWPPAYGGDPVRHAHEMIFGYAIAVIVGFLFTAGRNWSNLPTPHGPLLAAFFALWLAGRVLALTPWTAAAAIASAAFPIAAAVALAVPFVRSRNTRNYFFIGLLLAFGLVELAVQLALADAAPWPARAGLRVGLDIVLFIMAVVGGRVIPMFTNNAIPGAGAERKAGLEKVALGSLLALGAADALALPAAAIVSVAALATAAHAARFAFWRPWRTTHVPLVWILHVGYAWIVLHLALRVVAELQGMPATFATHALAVGAIGSMTLGMMTRTALGHTGLPLVAGRGEVVCYVLVGLAAVLRVFGPMVAPSLTVALTVASGLAWAAAFGTYAVLYAPRLARPRADGRPG